MTKTRLTCLALAGLCALVFFLRLHTYNEPLERDLTTYAVIAHEMLAGKALYSEMWDHKPPAIHVTYALAEAIAGYGRNSIFLMNIAATVATLFACYVAGSAAGGGSLGGLLAAALWAITSGDLTIEGNQPNTEVFLNACLTTAFAIFVKTEKPGLGWWRTLLAGVLFALASLYKQIAVVPVFFLACTHVASAPSVHRKQALIDITRIAAIGALAWAVVFTYFAVQNRSNAFVDATFIYNQFYAGSTLHNLSLWSQTPPLAPEALLLGLVLGTLTLTGVVLGVTYGPRRPWLLLSTVLIGTHVAVLLPGHFFPHYYQLWLPPLVIGAGWTVAMLKRILPVRFSWISYAAATTAIVGLGLVEYPYYQTPADTWSIRKYGPAFVATDRLARTLNKLLREDECFYEWGSESGLYYVTKQDPPVGIMFADPMLVGPLRVELVQRLGNELRKIQPDLLILEKQTVKRAPSHPILAWVKQNYRAISIQNNFLLLARKESKLDHEATARLKDLPRPAAL